MADLKRILTRLIEAAGVSGSEEPVAAVVESELMRAGYTASQIESDYIGNRWVRIAARDGGATEVQRLLVAHMDEIGLRVTSIRPDGICRVQAVGGIDPQLWEGTPVVVHTSSGEIPGCISPVSLHVTQRSNMGSSARLKIEELFLDVGVSNEADCRALGIDILDSVTWVKQLTPLANNLVQGRSLDDRFGCCALIALAERLNETPPPVPTVLAWSVQEELGLRGARVLAERFPLCREVIAVDSVTVGSGPRDNKQFDSVQLGGGPAIRAWDATTMMPESSFREALTLAEQIGVPLQYGFMQGGNDASVFEPSGARILGLGVPLAYSHSNVERIHMGDLEQLVELLAGWCHES
ncbi:MAG: M20/M25/M40 family metallo-hydrolase [bacterium]|nr:M20/M25/M40 family metallo-hydrolase [bacterium]